MDLNGIGQKIEYNAFFLGVEDFLTSCGKLFLTSAVDDMGLGTQTQSGSGCVHSNVAAADDDSLFGLHDRGSGIVAEGLHQIASGQVFVCGEYTHSLLAGYVHELGKACAGDLARMGYDVTIFEALHKAGGVLVYGIPEFRLPKDAVVEKEIENVKALGVKIETDCVIGKSTTVDALMKEEGFDAVFIGSGAGLPKFMHIPGEQAMGVFSANEYLTRSNLMKAFSDDSRTPIMKPKKAVIVGGGNVAMDAARTALRLGAETHIVYRRSEEELPARREEVLHAKEEGIVFNLLTNPVEIHADEKGWVKGITCLRMELGEPDASGRRSPVEIPGSEFYIECDAVIMSLGTSPNPLIASTTQGLDINRRKCIVANEENGQTSKEGVFAGGDAVTGAATVILAMGAGKAAAKGIDEYLSGKA